MSRWMSLSCMHGTCHRTESLERRIKFCACPDSIEEKRGMMTLLRHFRFNIQKKEQVALIEADNQLSFITSPQTAPATRSLSSPRPVTRNANQGLPEPFHRGRWHTALAPYYTGSDTVRHTHCIASHLPRAGHHPSLGTSGITPRLTSPTRLVIEAITSTPSSATGRKATSTRFRRI